MVNFLRTLFIGTVLALGVGTLAQAADTPDPAIGSWTLDLAKSRFSPGPAPKSQSRTYVQSAQGTVLTVTGVAADGTQINEQSTLTYDGKECALTGSPNYDTLILKRINGSTVKSTLKRGGKTVGTTTRSISAHGKVMTLSTKARDAKGMPYDIVAVFERQ